MLKGTVYNIGNNYYEVVDKNSQKIRIRWVNSSILKETIENDYFGIPVKVKKPGFKFKQYEVVKSKFPVSKHPNSKDFGGSYFKTFWVQSKLLTHKKLELRLTINNIIARLFLGSNNAKKLLNKIISQRLQNG